MTLTSEEWSSYRKYLLSNTRNDSDNFTMFELLQRRKEKLKQLKDADEFREKHFPQMTSKSFSNMMSRLFNWLEEWLAIYEFRKDENREKLRLINGFNRKGLFKIASSHARKLEKKMLAIEGYSIEQNEILKELYQILYYSDNPAKYDDDELLNKLVQSHRDSTHEQLLLYLSELHNWMAVKKMDLTKLIDETSSTITTLAPSPLTKELEHLLNFVCTHDQKAFFKLRTLLYENKINQESKLHTLLVYYVIAFSLRLWMKGKIKNSKDVMDVYEYALSTKVFLSEGKIPKVQFFNIITILVNIRSQDEMLTFVNEWIDKVQTQNVPSMRSLAYAMLDFAYKNYDQILVHLRDVIFEDFDDKTRAIGLQIIAFYKSKDLDYNLLNNKLDNFRRYLLRHKSSISDKYYWSHINLIKVIRLLCKSTFESITIDLNKYEVLIYRKWFLEQIKKAR